MQKGGNVNMTDKLCVEIYWNYQPFHEIYKKNIHVNIYVAVNLMIDGPDISGTGWMRVNDL
jgi:hypothetical protein